ncbi:DgyrCDS11644 [Dimorphilus gyrociliatus]|uniref:DgyrCDS11644 n=1 Tax=Dimorphilus gyrociliatus TaxID=2664684 RepID=A0A7I8W462_9ANNE|nr:DgyrCDS11644 [Dimorphilus gyrociliatus]
MKVLFNFLIVSVYFLQAKDVNALPYQKKVSAKERSNFLDDLFRTDYRDEKKTKDDYFLTARRLCKMTFNVSPMQFLRRPVQRAEIRVYKNVPRFKFFKNRRRRKRYWTAKLTMHESSAYTHILKSSSILDSKLVSINAVGWISFDITRALKKWIRKPSSNLGLELWVEGTTVDKKSEKTVRKTNVVCQNLENPTRRDPVLFVYHKFSKGRRRYKTSVKKSKYRKGHSKNNEVLKSPN